MRRRVPADGVWDMLVLSDLGGRYTRVRESILQKEKRMRLSKACTRVHTGKSDV
jgi:hypothetical protein